MFLDLSASECRTWFWIVRHTPYSGATSSWLSMRDVAIIFHFPPKYSTWRIKTYRKGKAAAHLGMPRRASYFAQFDTILLHNKFVQVRVLEYAAWWWGACQIVNTSSTFHTIARCLAARTKRFLIYRWCLQAKSCVLACFPLCPSVCTCVMYIHGCT